MDGEYRVVEFAPGINRTTTNYAAEGTYIDGDNIRFMDGRPRKKGGRVIVPVSSSIRGVPRATHEWSSLEGDKYIAYGTHTGLFVYFNNNFYDITPVRASVSASAIFNTSAGSNQVVISITGHNASPGDYIDFVSASTTIGDNILLNGVYEITSVVDNNSFIVSVTTTAAATSTGTTQGGKIDFLLGSGLATNGAATGWGSGGWGSGGWSVGTSGGGVAPMRQWSMDNWGEDLIANPRGGKIYKWVQNNGLNARAVEISAAPSIVNYVMVAQPTRHLMAYGCEVSGSIVQDPLLIRWSDLENYDNWSVSASSDAGFFRLEGANEIINAEKTKKEMLILTDSSPFIQRYVGNDFIFGFESLGTKAPCVGPQASVDINGNIAWVGFDGFYQYDGQVRRLKSTMDKYYFDPESPHRINFSQKEMIYAGTNRAFNELCFFVPTSNNSEIDTEIDFNYVDSVWYDCRINRTTWLDSTLFGKPYATNTSGSLYIHETGKDDNDQPLVAYIQSSDFDIGDGDEMLMFDRIIPDVIVPEGKSVTLNLRYRKWASDNAYTEKGPYVITGTTTDVKTRGRGRQMALRYSVSGLTEDFQIGKTRIRFNPSGKR